MAGAPPQTGGAYSAPPDPLAGFNGPTSKVREGREGKGGKGLGRGGGWDGREGKGGEDEREGGKGERMWRGPESSLPRGPCWLSAGLMMMMMMMTMCLLYSLCLGSSLSLL